MSSPEVPSPERPGASRKTIVAIAVLAVLMAQFPINLVSVSLPTIAEATGTGTAGLQWVQSIYILAMAAAVLSAGVIAENIGRKKVILAALALMAIGATIGGLSSLAGDATMPILWTAQAIAGLGGGALLPTTLATITMAVPDPRERGPYMSAWGAGTTGGLAVGAVVSGLVHEVADWGWIYAPAVVLAVAIFLLTWWKLPESPVSRPGMDTQGQIYATLAIIGLIFAVIEGGSQGWLSASAIIGLVVFVVSLGLFIFREAFTYAPLMDLKIFRNPLYSASAFAAAMALFSVVGTGFLLALFLGQAKELSPLGIGLYVVFMPGTAFIVSPLVGKLFTYLSANAVLVTGLLLGAVGTLLIGQSHADSSYIDVIWRIMVFGVAISMMFASVATVAVNSVPLHQASMAGSTNTVIRQVGGALGPAIIGSIYAGVQASGGTPSEAFSSALLLTTVLLGVAGVLSLAAGWFGRTPQETS